ncbi:hypothetical protein HA402_004369 [Bradysia odoriphaga]|nr:hypothetical protein HA402_004369 [Bradysia odoriphaga]
MADRTQAKIINVMNPKKKRVTQSERAILSFPVGRINRRLRDGRFAKRIGKMSAKYSAAVCEYLVAEVLDVALEEAREKRHKRINPRHITLGVRNDAELSQLLKDVTVSEGGVVHKVSKSSQRSHQSETYKYSLRSDRTKLFVN